MHNSFKNHQCVRQLCAGDVICYPTEGVWGLGCNPFNLHAVNRIVQIKQREWRKGLILVAADIAQLDFLLARLSQDERKKIRQSWPGPVTWLVPHHNQVPKLVSGESEKVAVRVSAHPVVRMLTQAFGGPIVSTSANPAGAQAAQELFQARRYFGNHDVCFAAGRVSHPGQVSQIRDLQSGEVLRS